MELQQKIEQALKNAMRAKDEDKRNAVRSLLTAIKNKEKDLRRLPDEGEIQQLIATQVKQRRESVDLYAKAGRNDLVEKEEKEIAILQEFLPPQLTLEELDALIDAAITETGAHSAREMGRIMKVLMPQVTGRAEGKMVNDRVRARFQA